MSGGRARALAGFVPDCLVLFKRLLGDARVPRGSKLLLALSIAYLAFPLDLIPDFIPVIGYLDDAVVVAAILRALVRSAGPSVVAEHCPGPRRSLDMVLRLAAP
jgi:uncharacterized membrane protein YkvA (DUF1232 family)